MICVSARSIFSNFLMPSLLSFNKNRSSHYSPSLSPSWVMSSPQILLISSPPPFLPSFIPSLPPHPLSIFIPPSPSCWCHLSAHTPTSEEFIPESGIGPFWGKVRGLSGNHVVECVSVWTEPLCFHGLYVSVSCSSSVRFLYRPCYISRAL